MISESTPLSHLPQQASVSRGEHDFSVTFSAPCQGWICVDGLFMKFWVGADVEISYTIPFSFPSAPYEPIMLVLYGPDGWLIGKFIGLK